MTRQIAPLTTDGWSVLHQFIDVDWVSLRSDANKTKAVESFASWLSEWSKYARDRGQSAAFHIFGEKGPLGLLHFRKNFKEIGDLERELFSLEIQKHIKIKESYVSVIEMGMYHVTKNIANALISQGIKQGSDEFDQALKERVFEHRESLLDRAYAEIPQREFFCFYPMNKKRGEVNNWYNEDLTKRAELMMEHGMTGRKYANKVQQIISGSIGFDGWEWGVDLFADDPLEFKNLVYEMRFDDATSLYGEFGNFWFGRKITDLATWFKL